MPSLRLNLDRTPHIHEYIRRDHKTYKCAHPLCTHYLSRTDLIGKASICAVCHTAQILLDVESLKRAKPRCKDCSNRRVDVERRQTEATLKELGIV